MLNLKLRAETKGGFVWKLAYVRQDRRGERGVIYKAAANGTCMEPSYQCNGSGRWMEVF